LPIDVTRYVPLSATSSFVIARAVGAEPKTPITLVAISVAAATVPSGRIVYSSTLHNPMMSARFSTPAAAFSPAENNTGSAGLL
jgi:hypothetical protein